mmetsp:Transcript_119173/g.381848  ORF Transcript_119173/g.381848 Transcript_119173/m.381848 type:complete len:232 (-) Transcript_119173:84-779(-)
MRLVGRSLTLKHHVALSARTASHRTTIRERASPWRPRHRPRSRTCAALTSQTAPIAVTTGSPVQSAPRRVAVGTRTRSQIRTTPLGASTLVLLRVVSSSLEALRMPSAASSYPRCFCFGYLWAASQMHSGTTASHRPAKFTALACAATWHLGNEAMQMRTSGYPCMRGGHIHVSWQCEGPLLEKYPPCTWSSGVPCRPSFLTFGGSSSRAFDRLIRSKVSTQFVLYGVRLP